MSIARLFIISAAVAVSIGFISWNTSQYTMEEARQQSFMMKACVDAGGQWLKNFGPTWDCRRPEARP